MERQTRIPRRRRASAALAAVLTVFSLAAVPAGDARAECLEEDDDRVTGEILVELVAGSTLATLQDVAARHGLATVHPGQPWRDWIPGLSMGNLRLPGPDPSEAEVDAAVSALEADPVVDRAEDHDHFDTPEGGQQAIADLTRSASMTDVLSQPASTLTHVPEARALATGRGVRVAVIDTAASLTNPATAARMAGPGHDVIGGSRSADVAPDGIDSDGDTVVDDSAHHGTHVAGLILAVAPEATILHVRVLDDDGKGEAFDVARGIMLALRDGADVINLSLGMPHESRSVEKAIERATQRGVVVVAAAGNRGALGVPCVDFPADRPEPEEPDAEVIAVAAVDDLFVKTPFSSYGPEVALSAPGDRVLSTWGEDQWGRWAGTSFATPLVSGGVALLLERYPGLASDEVAQVLRDTAQPDANPPELDGLMGAGVLDLAALVAVELVERETLRLSETPAGTVARWSPVAGATRRDLLRGSLANLRLAGGVVDLGALTCVADDVVGDDSRDFPDAESPGAGAAFFYVLRDDGTDPEGGTYGRDSAGRPREPASVDCAP